MADRYGANPLVVIWNGVRAVSGASLHENIARGLIALAHRDAEHKLRMPLDPDPEVGIAEQPVIFGSDVLLLLADEAPDFIAFHIAHLDVANARSHDPLTLLASEYQLSGSE